MGLPRNQPTRRPGRKATAHSMPSSTCSVYCPAEIMPRVFEKFVRSRRDDPPKSHGGGGTGGEGTGLGLAIVKGVIEAHGGSVTAESPVGANRGTRIILTFPREKPR